jgi:hypothetical protein
VNERPRLAVSASSTHGWYVFVLVAGAIALALLTTYPLLRSFGSALPGNLGDPLLNAWTLGWGAKSMPGVDLLSNIGRASAASAADDAGPRRFWDAPIFHPHRDTFAYSEHLLGITLFVASVYWISGNAILTYNVAVIASFALAATGMFLLIHAVTGRRDLALVLALAFAFSPMRVGAQVARLQMLMTGWLPLALWAVHRYGATLAPRYLIWFVVSATLLVLSNMYMLLIGAVPIALVVIFEIVTSRLSRRRVAAGLGAGLGVTTLLLAPVVAKYLAVQASMGFTRAEDEIVRYSATLRSYVSAFDTVGWLPWVYDESTADRALYVGGAVLLLVAAGLIGVVPVALRRFGILSRRTVGDQQSPISSRLDVTPSEAAVVSFYAAMTGIVVALSFGPVLHGWNGEQLGAAPYDWLRRVLPAVDGLRAPGRFGVVAAVGLTVLAAFSLKRLLSTATRVKRMAAIGAAAVLVLMEAWPVQFAVEPFDHRGRQSDAQLYAYLAAQPAGTLLELPASPYRTVMQNPVLVYQFQTLTHSHELVNGSSGFNSPLADLLEGSASPFSVPDRVADGVEMLQAIGVRYVALHAADYVDSVLAEQIVASLRSAPGVREHREFGTNHLFELSRTDRPPASTPPALPRILVASHQLVASHIPMRTGYMLDDRASSFWSTGQPSDQAWLQVTLSAAHDVRQVRLEMGTARDQYPRSLKVLSRDDHGRERELYRGQVLPRLAVGLVESPVTAPVAIPLPTNRTRVLTIVADDSSHKNGWSVDEFQLYGLVAPLAGAESPR